MRDEGKCCGPKHSTIYVDSQQLATLREATIQLLAQQVNDGRNDEAIQTIEVLNSLMFVD